MSRQTTKSPSPARNHSAATPSAVATAPVRKPTTDQIRKRAYELFLARRGVGGNPEQDWLQAERELTRELSGR